MLKTINSVQELQNSYDAIKNIKSKIYLQLYFYDSKTHKSNVYYIEYSILINAPISNLITEIKIDDNKEQIYIINFHLVRAFILNNKAGPNGECISEQDFLKYYK